MSFVEARLDKTLENQKIGVVTVPEACVIAISSGKVICLFDSRTAPII